MDMTGLRKLMLRLREGIAAAGAWGRAALHRHRRPPLDFHRRRQWQAPMAAAWLGGAVAAGTAWQDWLAMEAQARQAQAVQRRLTRLSEPQARQFKKHMLRLPWRLCWQPAAPPVPSMEN